MAQRECAMNPYFMTMFDNFDFPSWVMEPTPLLELKTQN
jgi:hypothetical protein